MNAIRCFSDDHHHFSGTHYVISEDVDLLVSRWCERMKLTVPTPDFYARLRLKMQIFLESIFSKVTFISSREIRQGLLEVVALQRHAGLTTVSLERAYLEDGEIDGRIELTRAVDSWGNDVVIPSVRNGTRSKVAQFSSLRGKNIALIDDVVFSGKTLIGTIAELHRYHANVYSVSAAIGVKSGVDNLRKAVFGVVGQPKEMTIDCLEEFDGLEDQVCERDFYPGIPYSGREHMCGLGSIPYVLPFGKPEKWASIPVDKTASFSRLCFENTIDLFKEIERLNGIQIPYSLIQRPVFGLPRNNEHFVSLLEKSLKNV